MSIFQKNINISINLCQYFKKIQYFNKFMSIFQINVNISLNLCQIPPWRGGFRPWGLAGILSALVQKFWLYIDMKAKVLGTDQSKFVVH